MENNYQTQIDKLDKKLDLILHEIDLQRQHRHEMEDLKDDLMRIGTMFIKLQLSSWKECMIV